jgi:hypothetical protein
MAKPRRSLDRDSLLVVLTMKVGLLKAIKVLTFIVCWGYASEDLGQPPETVEEYAYWWRMSAAKAFREQRLFRDALDDEPTPTRIWDQAKHDLASQVDLKDPTQKDKAVAALGGLHVAL